MDLVLRTSTSAADVYVKCAHYSAMGNNAAMVLRPGQKYTIDLALNGDLEIYRSESGQYDDRESMI